MASFQRAISSVYGPSLINRLIFGHGVVIHFILKRNLTVKKNSPDVRRFAFRHLYKAIIYETPLLGRYLELLRYKCEYSS